MYMSLYFKKLKPASNKLVYIWV